VTRRRTLEASLAEVRAEKVLLEGSVLGDRITRKLLDQAIATRRVVPEGGRFSLADLDELKRLAEGAAGDLSREQRRHHSGTELVAFEWTIDAERQWVLEGADPKELPEAFGRPHAHPGVARRPPGSGGDFPRAFHGALRRKSQRRNPQQYR
jgi:hypothetical protein